LGLILKRLGRVQWLGGEIYGLFVGLDKKNNWIVWDSWRIKQDRDILVMIMMPNYWFTC